MSFRLQITGGAERGFTIVSALREMVKVVL